ncbi:MAG: hypothetical protein ACYC6Y_25060 [Thermoguttaceae bacterium]
MCPVHPHELHLTLTEEETKLLRRAAGTVGSEDLSAWARHVLLKAARERIAGFPSEAVAAGEKKPASNRPKCGCGATASPVGECDGSCIMRF